MYSRKELRRNCSPIGNNNTKHFLCPIRSWHPLKFLQIVRWDSVPWVSFTCTWKLSSRPFSRPDWLPWISEDASSHVQNTIFLQTMWYGTWTRGVGSEVKFPSTDSGSVNKKPRNKRFLLLFGFYRFWSFFVYCFHSDIAFTKNCILTNFIS